MALENQEEFAKGIYWVGKKDEEGNIKCNPYLILDRDEAILIDPGSVIDFEEVYSNITKIIPLWKIKYVILDNQGPDFCSSIPLFEKKRANFKIITHWKTKVLLKYYGINSAYYIINEHNNKLVLDSGRELLFIPTPYLNYAGSFITYDAKSKVLFSSDLFGAFSAKRKLYAQNDYAEKMKAFHEHYMPSNDILKPIMQTLLKMDITAIAPQHGSIIVSNTKEYINILKDLECGAFINPVKRDLVKAGGYLYVCNEVLKRCESLFGREEVLDIIVKMDVKIDKDNTKIVDYNCSGETLWNSLFDQIYAKKNIKWILLLEPLAIKLSNEYNIALPSVYDTIASKEYLIKEDKKAHDLNENLDKALVETSNRLIRCPVTNLYNFDFFKSYLSEAIKENVLDYNPVLIILKLDNIEKIRFSYGEKESNRFINIAANIIKAIKDDNTVLFRHVGTELACYMLDASKKDGVMFAEKIRIAIATSNAFTENTTVSIGLVSLDEIKTDSSIRGQKSLFEQMNDIALYRLSIAESLGKNIVCSEPMDTSLKEENGKVLIVDTDVINVEVLKTLLENMRVKVFTADNGESAIDIAVKEVPDVIISEIMLPQKDGFRIRENLLMRSRTKNIYFIVTSYSKNENSIERALSLGIEHYFKKPYMLSELIGIVKLKIKGNIKL